MAVTSESLNMPSSGWSSHLYWLWILYNSAAFVVVLTAVAVLGWIGADVLQLSWEDRGRVAALLVATLGALLFGGLGALQWLIVPPACTGPQKPMDRGECRACSCGLALRHHPCGGQRGGVRH